MFDPERERLPRFNVYVEPQRALIHCQGYPPATATCGPDSGNLVSLGNAPSPNGEKRNARCRLRTAAMSGNSRRGNGHGMVCPSGSPLSLPGLKAGVSRGDPDEVS